VPQKVEHFGKLNLDKNGGDGAADDGGGIVEDDLANNHAEVDNNDLEVDVDGVLVDYMPAHEGGVGGNAIQHELQDAVIPNVVIGDVVGGAAQPDVGGLAKLAWQIFGEEAHC
jgi:hypothetical protein